MRCWGHPSLTAMRKAVASNAALARILAGVIPEHCARESCMTVKAQMHPHDRGHAHLGGHHLEPGERVDFDNSGMFASFVNRKRYRFLGVEHSTGFWYTYHAALKSEAMAFFIKLRSKHGLNETCIT